MEQAPNGGTSNDSSPVDINEIEEIESTPVIIKACGPTHFFHTVCILRWWCSANPMINTCPLDRAVAYGSMRVQQSAVDNVEFADFLGHEIDEHDDGLAEIPLTGNERTTIEFPDSFWQDFPAVSGTGRFLHRDTINRANAALNSAQPGYTANDIPEYAYYEVEDPSGYLVDHGYSDFEEITVEGYNVSEQSANDQYLSALFTRAVESVSRVILVGAPAQTEDHLDQVSHLVEFFVEDEPEADTDAQT